MSETVTTPVVVGNPHLRIILVDDESTKIPVVLGISPEREEELDHFIKKCFEEEDTITDTFAAISKGVKHANELAYCIFHVGANVGRQKALHDKLGGLLSGLRGAMGMSEETEDQFLETVSI